MNLQLTLLVTYSVAVVGLGVVLAFALTCAAVMVWAPTVGTTSISLSKAFDRSIPWDTNVDAQIFFVARLPRVLAGALVGATLAAAGVVLQALLRNPLATPFTLGVSAGVVVIPAAGMEHVALEILDAGDARQLGPVQGPGAHRDEPGPQPVAATTVVPNVVGMYLWDAVRLLTQDQLIVEPWLYAESATVQQEYVISQSLTAGQTVLTWSPITLTVSDGP